MAKIEAPKPVQSEEDIKKLKQELEEAKRKNKELESLTATSIILHEKEIEALNKKKAELEEELASFPRYLTEKVREYKKFDGSDIRYRVVDYSKWSDEQIKVRDEYNLVLERLKQLHNTLIAVTLIEDPDVQDRGLFCGVNGDIKMIFYSEDDRIDENGNIIPGTRVQLIPYSHYAAIMDSYKLKFRVKKDPLGNEVNVPYKVAPILKATMPTEEQIKKHKASLRIKKFKKSLK